jgi:hypothetical protein
MVMAVFPFLVLFIPAAESPPASAGRTNAPSFGLDVAPQGRWLGTTGFTRGAPLGTLARIKIKMKLTQNHLFFKKVDRIPDSNESSEKKHQSSLMTPILI